MDVRVAGVSEGLYRLSGGRVMAVAWLIILKHGPRVSAHNGPLQSCIHHQSTGDVAKQLRIYVEFLIILVPSIFQYATRMYIRL